jgi:P22_AR N-terminal domain/ORF6C domain
MLLLKENSMSNALIPVEVRTVDFYGDVIVGALVQVGAEQQTYVPLRPICTYLGIDWSGQRQRLMRDEVLADEVRFVVITPTNPQGGDPELLCIPLDYLPGWLFGVSASRVRPDLKEKIILYRRECFRVLWEAFRPQIEQDDVETALAAPESTTAISQLEQIIEQSRAMQRMAEEQIALIHRMDAAAHVVKAIRTDLAVTKADVADVKIRLGELEERLHPSTYITNAQAAEIQSAVATIAMALTQRDPSKNHFQAIHAELHRRFKVKSYSLIRVEQYAAVLKFLETWDAAMDAGGASETKGLS